jgi:hypothetical protein
LNNIAVNLDQTPLKDFEPDMEEGNGDEVEETEEGGVFDVS